MNNGTNGADLNALARSIYLDNKQKGFWPDDPKDRNAAECIALMHSELSEALEAIRKPGPSDHIPEYFLLEEELADAVIRILDFCGAHQLNLGGALEAKLAYNRTRPHKHGKLF